MNPITLTLTSTSLTLTGPASLTASVTNAATVPARVVLGAFPAMEGPGQPAAPRSAPPGDLVVPARPAPAAGAGLPWWAYLIAGALVVVVGVVLFLVLRPSGAPNPPTSSPTPTPTPTNPCASPYVPRLARPDDLTCVTTLSAAEARTDNDPELQRARKDPTGPYGPETCVSGYVWREAFEGDVTCVTGAVRTRTYWENHGYPEGRP